MRKLFSKNNAYTIVWFIFHLAIIIAFFATLGFYGGLNLDADFTTMLPNSSKSKANNIAEKTISAKSGNNIFILAGNPDFAKAKDCAEKVYLQLKAIDENPERKYDKFRTLSFYADLESYSDVKDFIENYRFNLLNEKTRSEINSNPQIYAENALSKFFGFSLTENDPENDPFLFDSTNLQNYLENISTAGADLKPKDGVLASQYDGKWYVMIRGELTTEGAKLENESNAIPDVYKACFPLETDGTRFAFFGTPFHSYKSAHNAVKEVKIITFITITAIIIMLFVVFRSILPLVSSLFSILFSIGASFLATHAIFGNVHMIGMIFGTSLIGSCIDYSLHYFINWKASPELKTGQEIRNHLTNGLMLSLVSTELCYLLLMLTPFDMLKQISMFSFVGIMSSYLTTVGIFPLFKLPKQEDRKIKILAKIFPKGLDTPESPKHRKIRKIIGKVVIVSAFAVTIITLTIRHSEVKIKNDLQSLYTLNGRLKEDSTTAFNVIKYNPISWIIISGNSAEDVLQREEKFIKLMKDPYICTSKLIPSINEQQKSIESSKQLLPFAESQYENLGFDEDEIVEYTENLKAKIEQYQYVTPENTDEIPDTFKSILKMLWIGNVDDKYYSIVLPTTVSDYSYYEKLAETDENIFYANENVDVSRGLDNLTKMIVLMFGIAFIIITIVMKFFYNARDTFKIVTIPLISILIITTTFVIAKLPIEFFCVTGVILVFGLGLDYVIYKRQNKGSKLEGFAITLSFLTTAISFGAVIFSTFVPVHVLGLSIFSGIIAAFICTML